MSVYRFLFILLLAASLVSGTTAAAEDASVKDDKQLAKQLRKVRGFKADEWKNAGFTATGVEASGVVLQTSKGQVALDRQHLSLGNLTPTELDALLADLEALPDGDKRLVLRYNPVLETYLRNDEQLVWREGTLKRESAAGENRETDVKALQQAVDALDRELDKLLDNDVARKSLRATLQALRDNSVSRAGDEMDGVFARHLLSHGWLEEILGKHDLVDQLVAAVETASSLKAMQRFVDGDTSFEVLTDAYGAPVYRLANPQGTRLMLHPNRPMYHAEAGRNFRTTLVVLDLKPGAAESGPEFLDGLTAAGHYFGNQALASWDSSKGFTTDKKLWRRFAPQPNGDYVSNYLPPHLLIRDLDGNVQAIITEHGTLHPPKPEQADHQRFITEAAKVLPDAPHLDLIGQYLFRYVYDSPDPSRPWVIGTRETSGDIHQTSSESMATSLGGVCRGDCDDISEFYQQIAEEQGKLAHIVIFPAHAALAWSEEKNNNWHTYVLQTGPALEFVDADLGESLRAANKHFDDTENFDPHAVGLLLRFSGENTRSSWRLSSRIFSDRVYAETMIDVQRDWHYQTYLQGIQKMEKLIASGDKDNANYRELAGLFNFTGQYDKAVDYLKKAKEMTPDPANQLDLDIETIHHLLSGERTDEAKELITNVLDEQIPALSQQMGPGIINSGMMLIGACAEAKQPVLAAKALNATAMPYGEGLLPQLVQIHKRVSKDAWQMDGGISMRRRIVLMTAMNAASILRECTKEEVEADADLARVQRFLKAYIDHLAFIDADNPGEVLSKYSMVGALLRLEMGEEAYNKAVLAAPLPAKDIDHQKRSEGQAQQDRDLSWIATTMGHWGGAIGEAFAKDQDELDTKRVSEAGKRLETAYANLKKLGMVAAALDRARHMSQLMVALAEEDDKVLRERLAHVNELDDKRLRDDTAQTLGDCARLLDKAWFKQVLKAWQDEVDYKPKYYWIAWRAALAGGTEQALMTAELAAERFKDDPAFVEEHAFMKKLFE